MNGSRDEKNLLRRTCTQKRGQIEGAQREAAEKKISDYLSSMASYRHARLLLFYVPIKSEVNVLPLLTDALNKGRATALPRCEKQPGVMTFRYVRSMDELSAGAFGVPEPSENALIVPASELASHDVFALVPALAFDKKGYRLGYGKGYYDRFLSTFGGMSAGVAFGDLIFDELPKGFYDRRVKAVVSERGVWICDA